MLLGLFSSRARQSLFLTADIPGSSEALFLSSFGLGTGCFGRAQRALYIGDILGLMLRSPGAHSCATTPEEDAPLYPAVHGWSPGQPTASAPCADPGRSSQEEWEQPVLMSTEASCAAMLCQEEEWVPPPPPIHLAAGGWHAAKPGCFGNISLRRQLSRGKQNENTQRDRCC